MMYWSGGCAEGRHGGMAAVRAATGPAPPHTGLSTVKSLRRADAVLSFYIKARLKGDGCSKCDWVWGLEAAQSSK